MVKVSGTGNDMELDIAFPQQGVKRLWLVLPRLLKLIERSEAIQWINKYQ
ncbi:MAG: hypothetical protein ACLSH6_09145 [Limosilactobacillus pontis]